MLSYSKDYNKENPTTKLRSLNRVGESKNM
jgi:hypothetical protein